MDQKMQISASRLSQKTRGMKEAMASSCCSTTLRGKGAGRGVEVGDATRFGRSSTGSAETCSGICSQKEGYTAPHSGRHGFALHRKHRGQTQQWKLMSTVTSGI